MGGFQDFVLQTDDGVSLAQPTFDRLRGILAADLTCWTRASAVTPPTCWAIEGEKSATLLAAMVRTVLLYNNRLDTSWTGGSASVTNHQVVLTLDEHPKLREFLGLGERIATATGMIKSAAAAATYLVTEANPAPI